MSWNAHQRSAFECAANRHDNSPGGVGSGCRPNAVYNGTENAIHTRPTDAEPVGDFRGPDALRLQRCYLSSLPASGRHTALVAAYPLGLGDALRWRSSSPPARLTPRHDAPWSRDLWCRMRMQWWQTMADLRLPLCGTLHTVVPVFDGEPCRHRCGRQAPLLVYGIK